MTDKECLMQLINSLGLTQNEGLGDSDWIESDNVITLGSGLGFANFFVQFNFDDQGKCVSHGVWE